MAHAMDKKPPKMAKIENKKEEKVCFKVTLLKKDSMYTDLFMLDEIEARRFVVPNDCRKSLLYLKTKIHFLFEKDLKNGMKIYYKDSDMDFVRIESDEELIIALSEMRYKTYHLFVVAKQ